MPVQKKTLTFNKENNKWYLECKEYEEEMTKLFRKNHSYKDGDGRIVKYEVVQDFTNPMDDHTKHPKWHDPKEDLIMEDSFVKMLEKKAKGKNSTQFEMISYGWVSNTFTHYVCDNIEGDRAQYTVRFNSQYPSTIHLTQIFQYLFERFPKYIHLK
jgi:hypothetical protein